MARDTHRSFSDIYNIVCEYCKPIGTQLRLTTNSRTLWLHMHGYLVSCTSRFGQWGIKALPCSLDSLTHSFIFRNSNLVKLARSRRIWLVKLFVHLLHQLRLGSYTYSCCTYFLSCTCRTQPHLLRVYLVHIYKNLFLIRDRTSTHCISLNSIMNCVSFFKNKIDESKSQLSIRLLPSNTE